MAIPEKRTSPPARICAVLPKVVHRLTAPLLRGAVCLVRNIILLTAALIVPCCLSDAAPRNPRADASAVTWRGWDTYQPIMWSTGTPADAALWWNRLREMGCTAEECYRGRDPMPFVQHGMGYYVENLIPELAYLHAREALYDEDFKGYTTTHDRRFLTRRPCLDDPAFWAEAEARVQTLVKPFVGQRPLLYNLQDELSLGRFASPMDYCFCPHTLRAFRRWLQGQYPSLAALNATWDTHFRSWEEVMPMTTYEIKARERTDLAAGRPENYAPWADHRAYMDLSFAQALGRLRGAIRAVDATTPVGIEGTQMPSAWGGYDLWRLSRVIDWVEPYDIAGSREIFRSFLPAGAPILGTVFGSDIPHIRRQLWHLLLHGDRGCIIWDDEKSRCIEKTLPEMPVSARGKALAGVFAELKAAAPKLMSLRRVDDRIAIHYSQASIRAHWMFDSRADGDTWPRRFSSYEAKHSRLARVRDSFIRVVEDLGLQYEFVSYEQLESGELMRSGYKALLLPESVAMSPEECRQIEAFVRAGGTVIADNSTATMDAHCRRLPSGQLDDLFGIDTTATGRGQPSSAGTLPPVDENSVPLPLFERGLRLTTGKSVLSSSGTPALITRRVGKGRANYLNVDMRDYGRSRLTPRKGDGYLALFRRLLRDGGVQAPIQVLAAADGRPLPGVEVWRYRGMDADYVALMRNPEADADSVGPVGYTDNAALEKTERARVLLGRKSRVTDLRSGQALGDTDRVSVELDPWSPTILELRRGH
jgi:Beta-galactosidase trimerisation domain/Beta-galactosidase